MIQNIPLQRLASPKALVCVVPTLLLLLGRLPEFIFFRFSTIKTYWLRLTVLLSGKVENYFNFLGFTLRKFNSLTVLFSRTTYLLTFKRSRCSVLYNKGVRQFNPSTREGEG